MTEDDIMDISDISDISDLDFNDELEFDDPSDLEDQEVDLSESRFPEVTKRFEPIPHQFFTDPSYYKVALANEGDISKRVHGVLQKFLNATDPKDRSVFRPQLISAYWELLRNLVKNVTGKLPEPKRFMLRYGLVHPNLINTETKNFFAKLVTENELNQPVYYVDEWLKAVGTGKIRSSTTDEVQTVQRNSMVKFQHLLEKAKGKRDGTRTLLRGKDTERRELEDSLHNRINVITEHQPLDNFEDISSPYTDSQRRGFSDVQDTLKALLRNNSELNGLIREFRQAHADVQTLQEKVDTNDGSEVLDYAAIDTEYGTIRQTAKMTIGRQGNHFPILTGEYFHCGPNDVGFRENIISMLGRIESIDPEAFCRYYRNRLNRIAPYVVLIPTYGDTGICWEPFDKHNRATSRGRIFIPMYPRNLYIAVLSAVADLRWQVAKEKASYHWMEEGLTGRYYQWFAGQKIKGNIKDYFVQDYIVWMTKEAEGIQKLDKELRGSFWRYMPFSQEVKEKLRNRSYVYQELYQRDLNRAMSDGY